MESLHHFWLSDVTTTKRPLFPKVSCHNTVHILRIREGVKEREREEVRECKT